jgi:uncharacterized phage protein (TIGR01671 family)
MREGIGLYRGKRTDNGEWVEGYFGKKINVYTSNDDSYIIEPTYNAHSDMSYFTDILVYEETVGQYTGENPAAKEKIFECDIVKRMDLNGDEFVGVVEYKECSFWIINDEEGYMLWDDCNEVIKLGNIHDNPELMG